jgi:hypothetical protein
MNMQLPSPDSEEIDQLLHSASEKEIYRVLYENQDKPLTIAQIRQEMGLQSGEQEQLGRRLRSLYANFHVEKSRNSNDFLYKLVGRREVALNTESINNRVRAEVLKDQRCAQCGRTPTEHHVVLHVDHKIPQEWGGTNDIENLQALCSDCNEGKKNLYATYDNFADKIQLAANYDEVHRRIGELLKAFDGQPVPSDLVEIVAKSKQYQDDWQKRMRELRELGWQYSFTKKKEGNRVRSYFILEHYEPWPEGSLRAAIKQQELRKKADHQVSD